MKAIKTFTKYIILFALIGLGYSASAEVVKMADGVTYTALKQREHEAMVQVNGTYAVIIDKEDLEVAYETSPDEYIYFVFDEGEAAFLKRIEVNIDKGAVKIKENPFPYPPFQRILHPLLTSAHPTQVICMPPTYIEVGGKVIRNGYAIIGNAQLKLPKLTVFMPEKE